MKTWLRIISLVLLSLFVGVMPGVAQNDQAIFNPHSEEPIIERGEQSEDAWDWRYTDPGAVTYYNGQFHMIRNGFNGWPASVQMGYLVSDDGVNWQEPQDNPVLTTEDVPFAEIAALASSLYVEEDGTWVLYFYTWNTPSMRSAESTIGRATANNPLGPWNVDAEPVLTFDETLDETSVVAPSVIQTDGGYAMYYAAYDEENTLTIRRATSDDGITWQKGTDPVLVAAEEWEGPSVHQPRVFSSEDGTLWMLYRATGGSTTQMRLGLAQSKDGIVWEKFDGNPVFQPRDIPGMYQFWFHSAVLVENILYLYAEATASGTTDIYALTADLPRVISNN